MRKKEEAQDWFRKALEIDSKHSMSLNILGTIELENGNLDKAEKHFKKALEYNPVLQLSMHNLAMVYLQKGELVEAEKQLEKALKINDNFVLGWKNLAYVRRELDNKKGAKKAEKSKGNYVIFRALKLITALMIFLLFLRMYKFHLYVCY